MPRPKKATDLEIQAAAYLAAEGYKQSQISDALGLSQAVISRMLGVARTNKWLEQETRFAEESLPDGRKAEVLARVFPEKLQPTLENLSKHNRLSAPPGIHVFPSVAQVAKRSDRDAALAEFGRVAARHVVQLVRPSTITGVTWGRTVAAVVQGVREQPVPQARKRPTRFIPLCGEPFGHPVPRLSSSPLAAQLAQLMNGTGDRSFSLSVVPYLIPVAIAKNEIPIIKKLIQVVEPYREIYGKVVGKQPLINEVDTVITSVGAGGKALGFGDTDAARITGIKRERLESILYGDIGGALVPRDELDARGREELEVVRRRCTGLELKHLKTCARMADKRKTAGVVVVAIGRDRREIVSEGIRRGLINHLLIDQELAEALTEPVAA